METIMIEQFSRELRYRRVLNRHYTQYEMDHFRIKAFYNAIGNFETMTPEFVSNFVRGCVTPGSTEMAVIEKAFKGSKNSDTPSNPAIVVTVTVFRDRDAFIPFALKDGLRARYFHDGEFDEPVLGFLN